MDFCGWNSLFWADPDFEIALKTAIFKIFGYARNGTSVNKNPFLRPVYNRYFCHITVVKWSRYARKGTSVNKNPFLIPLYNRYFCHITIVKWSRIIQKSIKKCIFKDILILGLFSIKFPTVMLKIYQHRKEKSYRG